jgi:hypothetical protein
MVQEAVKVQAQLKVQVKVRVAELPREMEPLVMELEAEVLQK